MRPTWGKRGLRKNDVEQLSNNEASRRVTWTRPKAREAEEPKSQ